MGESVTYTSLPPAPRCPTPAPQFPKGKGPGGLSRRARPRPAPRSPSSGINGGPGNQQGRPQGLGAGAGGEVRKGWDAQATAHVCTPPGIWSRGRDAPLSPHTREGRRDTPGSQTAKPKPLRAVGGAGPPGPPRPRPTQTDTGTAVGSATCMLSLQDSDRGGSWARTRAGLAQWLEDADHLSSVSCTSTAAQGRRGRPPGSGRSRSAQGRPAGLRATPGGCLWSRPLALAPAGRGYRRPHWCLQVPIARKALSRPGRRRRRARGDNARSVLTAAEKQGRLLGGLDNEHSWGAGRLSWGRACPRRLLSHRLRN